MQDMIKNVIHAERRILNLKCEVFSKKFNYFSVKPEENCGPLYSILSMDPTKGIIGTFSKGIFKYEIEIVQMTTEEIRQMQEKKNTPIRRASILAKNPSGIPGGLFNSLSNKSLDSLEDKQQKMLEKKYKHVGNDLKQARGEVKSKLSFKVLNFRDRV